MKLKFEMEGVLKFSKELSQALDLVSELLSRTEELLTKGAPKGKEAEAAKLKKWRAEGREIRLWIESGRYVRAHDALLRIARFLAAELGKRHKIGLRGIRAADYVVTISAVEIPPAAEPEIKKLGCEISGDRVVIHLRDLSEGDIRGRLVDRLVASVQELLRAPAVEEAKAEEAPVVRRSPARRHRFRSDPFEEAVKLGWVVEFPGRGQWIYRGPYVALLRAIEELIITRVAEPLGFEEVMLPKLIPLEVMQRMPGYLDGVPEGMYYVSPPPRDPESFEDFKRQLRLTKRVPVELLRKVLKEPAYVLAPAQCEPFYEQFSREVIPLERTPVKQFDRSGWTYRWEGGGVEGLIRTQEFRRIEFVMMGSPEDVTDLREKVLNRSTEILEDLEMEWRITEATPFYMREGARERAADPRKVATYDLEVFLPYKNDWLEIGSYNVHRTKFTESFKIKEAKGREMWTGCCGFGTSRWVVGFLAQHGLDVAEWPEPVRGLLKRSGRG